MRVHEWDDGRVEIIRLTSKKLTIRQKDRIRAASKTIPSPTPSTKTGDRLGAVAAYFQQFEKDQKELTKAQNLRAAERRQERAQAPPKRTFLSSQEADIST